MIQFCIQAHGAKHNMTFENYSVLMCVYYKEKPECLEEAINSVLCQTKPTNDFVIVCDGPLTKELDCVLDKYSNAYDIIHVVRLEKNSGVGAASQYGLSFIKNEVFAKMDSDDVCDETRMEKELKAINNGYDVVGGAIAEFIGDKSNIVGIRMPPENHEDIVAFSKKRNPVNNVTIMYKKSRVVEAGGYLNANFLEDYTLDVKLIQKGNKFYNIQDVLVYVRTDNNQIKRRGDKKLRKGFKELRKMMLREKYISKKEYLIYSFEGFVFMIMPGFIKKALYKKFLRKKK